MTDKSIFYDIYQTLSYNCLFNFVVGNRGGGKTYGFKLWAIRSFLKTGAQFAYVRRYSKEFKKISKFFDDIKGEFPEHTLEVKGMNFYIDKQLAGVAIPLATAKIEKSVPMPLIDKICFDEFILDKGVYHYLPDEVTSFLELYSTIARLRDVSVFFMSNAITITNPYFIYFDLTLPYGKTIARKGDMLLELVQKKEFIETVKQTRFGKMIEGTAYGDYAIENQFLRDNKNFIEKKSGKVSFYFAFTFNDKDYGVWVDYRAGKMYVSEDVDPCGIYKFALTNDDHNPNTMFLKSTRKVSCFQTFVENYLLGNVRFETVNIKNICNQIIKWTL